jgi:hypothetical protein
MGMHRPAWAALALAGVVVGACGHNTDHSGATGPVAGPPRFAPFETPADSQTIFHRLLYMRLDPTGYPPLERVVFYVDSVSIPDGVDTTMPYEFAWFDPSWAHGSWHTVSALLDGANGHKYFSDTLHLLFLPVPKTDTLIAKARFSRATDRAYAITRLAYGWDAHLWLKEWSEENSDGNWSIVSIARKVENDEIHASLPAGPNFWAGAFLDTALVWQWADHSAWTYSNWTGPAPQNRVEDGLVFKADGYWTDGARFAPLPIVMQVTWAP